MSISVTPRLCKEEPPIHRTAHRSSRCVLFGGTFRAPQSFAAGESSADPPDPTFLIPALRWNTPPASSTPRRRNETQHRLNAEVDMKQPCFRKGARGSVAPLKQGSRFDHPVSVHCFVAPVYSKGPLSAESGLQELPGAAFYTLEPPLEPPGATFCTLERP